MTSDLISSRWERLSVWIKTDAGLKKALSLTCCLQSDIKKWRRPPVRQLVIVLRDGNGLLLQKKCIKYLQIEIVIEDDTQGDSDFSDSDRESLHGMDIKKKTDSESVCI